MLYKGFYFPNLPISNHSYSALLPSKAGFIKLFTEEDAKLPLVCPESSILEHVKADISRTETA